MFYVLQNESVAARRRVPILLTDAATGTTAQAGVALTTIYAYVNSNGGSFAGGAGTIANSGFGQYYYELHPDEIDTLGLAGIHVTALACRDYDSIVQVAALDFYSAAVGITAGSVWNYVLSNSDTAETNLVNASAGGGATAYAIAQEVWDFDISEYVSNAGGYIVNINDNVNDAKSNTNNIPLQVWGDDLTAGANSPYAAGTAGTILYGLSLGGSGLTAGDIWEYDISAISTAGTAGSQLNLSASGGSGLTAGDVWDFNITGFGATNSAAVYVTDTNFVAGNIQTYVSTQTPQDVWTYAGIEGRTITGGAVSSVLDPVTFSSSQYSAIASSVWNAGTRTITGGIADTVTSVTNPVSITSASMTGVAGTVWNSPVASYSSNGTFGLNILRADAANKVGDVTLRSAGGINMVDADMHRIDNDADASTNLKNILTGIGSTITGNIVGNVSGNVTGSVGSVTADVNVSTASMTGIAGTVWSYATRTLTSATGISAYDVWNFDPTAMTVPQAGAILTDIQTDTNTIQTDISNIPNNVWASDISGYTNPGEAGFELSQAASGAGLTSGDVSVAVWDSATSNHTTNGTFGYNLLRSDLAGVAGTVSLWTGGAFSGVFADTYRIDEDYNAAIALKDILTGVGSTITGNIDGNVTGSVGSVTNDVTLSAGTQASIANSVWSTDISGYTSPSAGYDLSNVGTGSGLTAGDVWTYATRTVTGGTITSVTDPVDVSASSRSSIASTVWNQTSATYNSGGSNPFANLIITQNQTSNIIDRLVGVGATVWEYATRTLTSGSGISAGDVWTYATRTITGGIADTVTTVTNGVTVTTNNDKTGYELSGSGVSAVQSGLSTLTSAQVGTEVDSSLSDVGLTSTVTGRIDVDVSSRLASSSYVTPPTESSIAGTVWNYATRTLTSGGSGISAYDVWNFVLSDTNTAEVDLVQAAAGSGLTAGDVWSAPSRTITGGIADTVSNVTGNVSGSVGSVLGNVSGNVVGSVASVTGDVSGNVVGSVANVTGNVSGSVGSVLGNVSGNVVGSVASVTGNVSGNVVGSVGSVTGNVAGTVAAVTGNVSGNVVVSVGSVTGNVAGSVNSVVTDVSVDESLISADVWSYVSRTLTSSGSGISAADVWTYATRTITGGIADTVSNVTGNVVGSVGSVLGNVSGNVVGTVGSVTGNVSGNVVGSVASVLGNVSGNVVGSVASVTGNVAGSVASVTGNVVGSVGSVTGNVAGSVASVTNPVIFDSAQYASIASSVWNAATRTLTSGGSGISAYDVWNFVLSDTNTAEVDLVQAASGAGLTAGDVWTYGSREITGGLANTVTSVTNPVTVGTNNDKTGYALSAGGVTAVQSGLSTLTQAQVGTEVDSSLSDVGLTSTVTGRIDVAVSSRLASSSYETPPTAASIASSVWSAGSRTITGGTVDNLTNPATVATSSMTGIAGTVWNYSTRTITSGGGATAGDVWTYPTRSLTSGAGITVNAATNIINGPYFVKSNVDGQDGNLDVITGMVQDIQLTVTDAFGNPFDTTALGLAVNFYNQAGTLTTSYGTSQLYGPAGLVQFTLDTAVTGVEGRYNLILSAAGAGNTIKFGPLTTLVRPY